MPCLQGREIMIVRNLMLVPEPSEKAISSAGDGLTEGAACYSIGPKGNYLRHKFFPAFNHGEEN